MTVTHLLNMIRNGQFDHNLAELQTAIQRRRDRIRKHNIYRPQIGDKVTLRDWFPQTTEGRVGTVLYSNKEMAIVTFMTENQQFIDCHVPLKNCAPVQEEAACEL